MKKLLFFLFFISSYGFAQPYYFLQDQSSYEPLTDSTSLNNGVAWSGFTTFTVPIGFNFNFMGSSFSSVDFEATGRLIFDVGHLYFADMFVVNGMQDKGSGSSLSPLSYKLTGSSGNQILKIEVNNATYSGDPSSTINFQIWLYEYTSRIELHVGPNTINSPSSAFPNGPFSGVFHITTWSPLTYGYGLMAYGDSSVPNDTTFSGTGINTTPLVLDDAPNEGDIYIYTDDTSFLSVEKEKTDNFLFYPNPATNEVWIYCGEQNYHLTVLSLEGKVMIGSQLVTGAFHIDIYDFEPGIYLLNMVSEQGNQIVKKFIKVGK